MKRFVTVLALILLASFLFVGCSNNAAAPTAPPPTEAPQATEPPATPSPTEAPTEDASFGEVMEGDGYAIDLLEGWTIQNISGINIAYSPDGLANLNIVFEPASGLSAKEYYLAGKEYLADVYDNVADIEDGSAKIGEYDGYMYTFSADVSDVSMVFKQYYLVTDGNAYVITYTETEGADFRSDLERMIATFRITDVSASEAGYSIDIPDDWTIDNVSGIEIAYSPDRFANVNVVSEPIRADMSPKEYYLAGKEYIGTFYENITDLDEGDAKVGAYDGYMYTFTGDIQGTTLMLTQYYVVSDLVAYVITYNHLPDTDYQDDVDAMIKTFIIN